MARSRTHPAIGPTWSMLGARGTTPATLARPYVGLQPATPQYDAGRMIEPPVWEPRAPTHRPQATAAAEPLLEPPGVRWLFHGFRVGGGSKLAYCVVTVLPSKTAPAWRSRRTTVASCRAMLWAHSREPAAVGQSNTSKMSLMPIGIPCIGPRQRCCRSSAAAVSA